MPQMPWIKWFPSDWVSDPCLTRCKPATRGIWIDVICAIRLSGQGELTASAAELSRLCRCSEEEMIDAIDDLIRTGTAEIEKQNESITISCRRIARERHISTVRSEAGKKGGRPKANEKQSAKQSVASASASVLNRGDARGEMREVFERVWKRYPCKQGKHGAWKAWKKHCPDEQAVLKAIDAYVAHVAAVRSGGRDLAYAHGSTWFSQQRWEDEYEEKSNSACDAARQRAILESLK